MCSRLFLKILENAEKELFRKSYISKNSGVWCFFFKLARWVRNHLYLNSKKLPSKPLFSSKFDFCIFEPKNCEVIENSFKAPFNFSPLKCTYLGKVYFNVISAKSEKMKLKSGHLELLFVSV